MTDVKFDPNIKDGRGTRVLAIPKSNGANTVDEPPVRSLRGNLRPHLHLRRAEDRFQRARDGHRRRANPPCSRPASWWAGWSTSIIRAAPA